MSSEGYELEQQENEEAFFSKVGQILSNHEHIMVSAKFVILMIARDLTTKDVDSDFSYFRDIFDRNSEKDANDPNPSPTGLWLIEAMLNQMAYNQIRNTFEISFTTLYKYLPDKLHVYGKIISDKISKSARLRNTVAHSSGHFEYPGEITRPENISSLLGGRMVFQTASSDPKKLGQTVIKTLDLSALNSGVLFSKKLRFIMDELADCIEMNDHRSQELENPPTSDALVHLLQTHEKWLKENDYMEITASDHGMGGMVPSHLLPEFLYFRNNED
jgi:hypothetical protein